MKNIYKILLLTIVMVLGSCAVNDDDPVTGVAIDMIEASVVNNVERMPASDVTFDLVVNFSKVIPQRGKITYTIDGVEESVEANAGTSSAVIRIDMSNDMFRTVNLTKFQMLYADAENVATNIVLNKNTTTVVKGDNVIIQMNWASSVDIDLVLTDAPAPTAPFTLTSASAIDASLNIIPQETVTLLDMMPAGDYSVSIIPYQAFNTPIELTLNVYAGTQAYNFTGTINSGEAATGGFFSPLVYNTVVEFAKITKTVNAGATTYTVVNQL